MITLSLTFTTEQAAALFRNVGLVVEMRDVKVFFDRPNRPGYYETIPMWIVENPYNGKEIPLEQCFRDFLEQRKKELFLPADKIQIFQIFGYERKKEISSV